MKCRTAIRNWAEDDRPREKLIRNGAEALSNAELLAVLLNNGTRNKSAVELARDVLDDSGRELNELARKSIPELTRLNGIGSAKAVTILAALELGRRKQATPPQGKKFFSGSDDVAVYLKNCLADKSHEVFGVLYLNQANRVNHFEIISEGGITGTVADPRIILRKALEKKAVSIILCHNHPSGNLKPSVADKELTFKVREAARYHEIQVLDHIIVSETGYYSFADNGNL